MDWVARIFQGVLQNELANVGSLSVVEVRDVDGMGDAGDNYFDFWLPQLVKGVIRLVVDQKDGGTDEELHGGDFEGVRHVDTDVDGIWRHQKPPYHALNFCVGGVSVTIMLY